LSIGFARPRRPKTVRRKVVQVVVGLGLIGAGLLVFRYATEIAGQVEAFVAPPPEGSDGTGLGFQYAYLPFLVWGFGFTLIGLGGNALRTAFLSPVSSGMGGGFGGGASLDEIQGHLREMEQMMAATRAVAPRAGTYPEAPKEVVKIKCRNCGNLESEDAAFCRKCGQPL
jgi:ribosomal protein L40E